MEKQITQTIWCCDVCGRQGSFLGTCQLCGKEHCSLCMFYGYNPTNIDICSRHQDDDNIKEAMRGFEKKFSKLKTDMVNEVRKVVLCSNLESKNESTI